MNTILRYLFFWLPHTNDKPIPHELGMVKAQQQYANAWRDRKPSRDPPPNEHSSVGEPKASKP